MYFTELTNSAIGSVTNNGKIRQYTTPTNPPYGDRGRSRLRSADVGSGSPNSGVAASGC